MKYSYICLPLIAAAFIAGCGDDEAAPQPAAAAGKTAAASVAADRAGAAGAEQAAKVKRESEDARWKRLLSKPLPVGVEASRTEGDTGGVTLKIDNAYDLQAYRAEFSTISVCVADDCQKPTESEDGKTATFECKNKKGSYCSNVYDIKVCLMADVDTTRACGTRRIDFGGDIMARMVTVGYEHACSLGLDGTAVCWGQTKAYANADGSTPNGEKFRYITASRFMDMTCGVSMKNELKCYGDDAARFDFSGIPEIKSVELGYNSLCWVNVTSFADCRVAKGEPIQGAAFMRQSDHMNGTQDIKQISMDRFYSVALNYRGRLRFYGYDMDLERAKTAQQYLSTVESVSNVKSVSAGNDVICVIAGAQNLTTCYGPQKDFAFGGRKFVNVQDAEQVSVGQQSACVIFKSSGQSRVTCDGLPQYFSGLKEGTPAIYVSQGPNQVCIINPRHVVECYGTDFYHNGINSVPKNPDVPYEPSSFVRFGLALPDTAVEKLAADYGNVPPEPSCSVDAKGKEIVCRIYKMDDMQGKINVKASFEYNGFSPVIKDARGKVMESGEAELRMQPQTPIQVTDASGATTRWTLRMVQLMRHEKTFSVKEKWTPEMGKTSDFICIWKFDDGATEMKSCAEDVTHVFLTDLVSAGKNEGASVEAASADFIEDGTERKFRF